MPQMYGDLITGLTFTAALPLFVYKAVKEPSADLVLCQATVCCSLAGAALCCLKSWWNRDRYVSYVGFSFMTLFSMTVCYNAWPFRESKALLAHMLWHMVMATANTALSFMAKSLMGIVAIIWALLVCCLSPVYSVEEKLKYILAGLGKFGMMALALQLIAQYATLNFSDFSWMNC
jgi:hypothetical protein